MQLKRYLYIFFTTVIVFCIDQVIKFYVLAALSGKNLLKVNDYVNIVKVWNRGVTFGVFGKSDINPWVFIMIATLLLIIALWVIKNSHPVIQGIVAGGAFGNIYDRVRFGGVLDFLDFHIYNIHYPAFNIADVFIVCGLLYMIVQELFFKK